MQQSTHHPPSLLPNLSQMNQVHIASPYFSKIHFNIIVPHTLRSSTRFLYFSFLTKTPPTPLLAPMRAMCLAHLILRIASSQHLASGTDREAPHHALISILLSLPLTLHPAYEIPLLRAANFHTSLNKPLKMWWGVFAF
jgi:hypothetical protein